MTTPLNVLRGEPFGERPNVNDVRMPMANADPRSRAMFGAAYFVGYCASLGLESGTVINAVALGDTMGDRGLVADDGKTVRQLAKGQSLISLLPNS